MAGVEVEAGQASPDAQPKPTHIIIDGKKGYLLKVSALMIYLLTMATTAGPPKGISGAIYYRAIMATLYAATMLFFTVALVLFAVRRP